MHTKQEKGGSDIRFEEALQIAGYGKFSVFIVFLTGLTICCSFLSSLDVSFLLPAAQCDLELTSQDKGLLSSAYFFGIISMSYMSGFLADTLGRRYVLLRGITLNIFTYVFGAFAPNFLTFFLLKVVSGIVTCPCMIAAFPLLGEYIPEKKRAQTLLIATSLSTLGLFYSALVGWIVLQQEWEMELLLVKFTPWRLFYLLCGLPSLLCAFLFCITPESPKFLLTRGKKGDTLKVLQRVYSVNSGKVPQNFPVMSVTMDDGEAVPPAREKGIAGVLKNLCDQTLPLFKPQYVKNLMICIIMLFIVFFCVNSIILWLPEVTNRIAMYKEANEGRFYLCEMLSKESIPVVLNISAELNTSAPVVCDATINTAVFAPNVLIGVVQPVIMVLASLVVPLVDRRITIAVVLIACSSMAFFLNWIPNASVIIILFGGIPILISICFNVTTSIIIELFPTYIRAMAVSLTMICGRLGSIFGSYLFSFLIDDQCSLLFQVISTMLLCCAVVPFFLKLNSRKAQKQSIDDFPSRNGTI